MKLTDEERNSLVILQPEKAKVFLKQADEMFDMKYWDIASNRYYYACFHAVQALLIQNDYPHNSPNYKIVRKYQSCKGKVLENARHS